MPGGCAARRVKDCVEFVELAAYAATDLFAEFEHAFVGDRVADMVAILGACDHAGGVENAEVFGDVLLGGFERVLELGDGGVACAELVEELDTHRLGEHAEASGDEFDEWLGERVGHRVG
jgi:hypothetical protein